MVDRAAMVDRAVMVDRAAKGHGGVPVDGAVGPVASLNLHGVSGMSVGRAVLLMGASRRPLQRVPGLRFWKLLGTGDGRTFTLRDADPQRWGLFAVWDSVDALRAYENSEVARRWTSIADESWSAILRPVASHGLWAGRDPFAGADLTRPQQAGNRIAALTRAKVKPSQWRSFWKAVPPVAADALHAPGLRWGIGIGEAPVGLQATFSLWDDEPSLRAFAYRGAAHAAVIEETKTRGWYSEELFARFEVLSTVGTVEGVAW
jgi:heme-degrading monooxygenase HmoA